MTHLQSKIELFPSYEVVPSHVLAASKINPLLKWPGGKTGELSLILPELPLVVNRYFEPFLGGGAVFFSIAQHIPALVNDKSTDLMEFYNCVREENIEFFAALKGITNTWEFLERFVEESKEFILDIYGKYAKDEIMSDNLLNEISLLTDKNQEKLRNKIDVLFDINWKVFVKEVNKNIVSKIIRTYEIECKYGDFSDDEIMMNIESAVKSGYYMYLRYIYNQCNKYDISKEIRAALFFFIREYSYASMFRFNNKGHFNVPYGGITYNKKKLYGKIKYMKDALLIDRMNNTEFFNMDFLPFLRENEPDRDDFIFLDPPYDTEFSNYDKNNFTKDDQFRLSRYLIDECKAKFMIVIKYTEYIASLYENKSVNVKYFDKRYMWTIKERNDRDTVHMMIKNY
jgi:DNA adenine methylase